MEYYDDIKVTFDPTDDIKTTLDGGSIQYGRLEIGTTTTGEAGTEAAVTNSGSSSHAILNFTIPKGENGESGVYIGTEPPTDPSINVWINPEGNADKIPTKTSELENDSGFISEESDPTVPAYVKNITEADIEKWNSGAGGTTDYKNLSNKPTINGIELDGDLTTKDLNIETVTSYNDLTDKPHLFSGSYNDLTDKPTIPTKTSELTNDSKFLTEVPSNYVTEEEMNTAIANAIGNSLGGSY